MLIGRSWRGPPARTSAAAGALLTADPDRAHVEGFVPHLGFGELFALATPPASRSRAPHRGRSVQPSSCCTPRSLWSRRFPCSPGCIRGSPRSAPGWRLGRLSSHRDFSGCTAGRQTPLVTIVAHLAYDAILGLLLDLSCTCRPAALLRSVTTRCSATPGRPRWSRPTGRPRRTLRRWACGAAGERYYAGGGSRSGHSGGRREREPGGNPGLPRSGERERPPSGSTGLRPGKRRPLGGLVPAPVSPKTCRLHRADPVRCVCGLEGRSGS